MAWDRRAGPFRALGAEHLANAAGFLARGAPARALIDLAAARALEPANPAIHAAAAPLLVAAGAPPPPPASAPSRTRCAMGAECSTMP